MSRLDSFIRRLEAQRACLGHVRSLVDAVPGCIFEVGLGNGRTYDHIRGLFPQRETFAFEIRLVAHPSCIPDDEHLFMGDFLEVLPQLEGRFAGQVALVHADCCGSGQPERDARVTAGLTRLLAPFLAPKAIVLSDRRLDIPDTEVLDLPGDIAPERYFIARNTR